MDATVAMDATATGTSSAVRSRDSSLAKVASSARRVRRGLSSSRCSSNHSNLRSRRKCWPRDNLPSSYRTLPSGRPSNPEPSRTVTASARAGVAGVAAEAVTGAIEASARSCRSRRMAARSTRPNSR
jgi:hypothetical protein